MVLVILLSAAIFSLYHLHFSGLCLIGNYPVSTILGLVVFGNCGFAFGEREFVNFDSVRSVVEGNMCWRPMALLAGLHLVHIH